MLDGCSLATGWFYYVSNYNQQNENGTRSVYGRDIVIMLKEEAVVAWVVEPGELEGLLAPPVLDSSQSVALAGGGKD